MKVRLLHGYRIAKNANSRCIVRHYFLIKYIIHIINAFLLTIECYSYFSDVDTTLKIHSHTITRIIKNFSYYFYK